MINERYCKVWVYLYHLFFFVILVCSSSGLVYKFICLEKLKTKYNLDIERLIWIEIWIKYIDCGIVIIEYYLLYICRSLNNMIILFYFIFFVKSKKSSLFYDCVTRDFRTRRIPTIHLIFFNRSEAIKLNSITFE